MGIIIKQSFRNFISSYLGVIIGALYTVFIIPYVFDKQPEQWGVIQLIVNYGQILAPFALLGMPQSIIRFLPHFKDDKRPKFMLFVLIITISSLILVSIFFLLFNDNLFNIEDNQLLVDYKYYTLPILALIVFFEFFSHYSIGLLKTVIPTFLKDLFPKIWTLILLIALYQNYISFNFFVVLFVGCYLSQLLAIIGYILYLRKFKFISKSALLKRSEKIEIFKYGGINFLTASTGTFVNKIDILMIGYMLTLKDVAYYSIAIFFAAIIVIPSKSINSIAAPIISDSWKTNNLSNIKTIYSKSSLNLIIVCSFIFLFVWCNIDDFMSILGEKFGQGKYIVLFLGLSRIFTMTTSVSRNIIITSAYYSYDLLFQIILAVTVVCLNLFLIPAFGLNGAALGTAAAVVIYNVLKLFFIYFKFKMQPYSLSSGIVIALGILCWGILSFVPNFENIYLNITMQTLILIILFFLPVYFLKISVDINSFIDGGIRRFLKK